MASCDLPSITIYPFDAGGGFGSEPQAQQGRALSFPFPLPLLVLAVWGGDGPLLRTCLKFKPRDQWLGIRTSSSLSTVLSSVVELRPLCCWILLARHRTVVLCERKVGCAGRKSVPQG
ncbi:UNVERIFIED_CONTAM: hypothetical protein K2H54_017125 [Gekko kuhli]